MAETHYLSRMTAPSLAPEKPCPICGKPAAAGLRPFCSKRCADIDLNRWLSGVYAVPTAEREDDSGPDARKPDEPE